MLRTTIAKAYIKRTFRPLYGWDQMTPKSQFLDASWNRSIPIFPGMVMQKNVGENVTLVGGVAGAQAATAKPYGFSGLYIGGDGIDEVLDSGINATAVWVMAADAEAEVLAPAFNTGETWTEPTNGSILLVNAFASTANQGKLTLTAPGATVVGPVARLLKVVSTSKIIIGGLSGTV